MKTYNRQALEHRIETTCSVLERVILRLLLFGCFTFEVIRFVHWLLVTSLN